VALLERVRRRFLREVGLVWGLVWGVWSGGGGGGEVEGCREGCRWVVFGVGRGVVKVR
jgi:hypothetical protein